jgi:hypothetical protein
MPERPSELYHFSEDPSITRFEPHIAATSIHPEPVVWAIDADHADIYYFPRNCPRVTFYAGLETTNEDVERFLGFTSARRVSAIESAWLPAMRETSLHRYVFPADGFELITEGAGSWVSRRVVKPVRVEPVGDLIDALVNAGVELRVMPSLWALYEAVIASTLGFSIIRWRNASPRPEAQASQRSRHV